MANDLVVFEQELRPLVPRFEEVLGGIMPVDRLTRTALVAVERNMDLLNCNRQSLFNGIMTCAVLGLELDGVTGQAYLIPFKRLVQPVVGYRGYNTLGARAGLTITGNIVREGDEFEYELGSGAFVKHKPKLGNTSQIIGAWSVAAANDRPPIIEVLGIDELLAVKNKSPGAKRAESPWNDPTIGFPAMCAKTAKRRLARSTPLSVHAPQMMLAARMEEAFEEQGKYSCVLPDRGVVIEGETSPVAPRMASETPEAEEIMHREKPEPETPLSRLKADGMKAANKGMQELLRWWHGLNGADANRLLTYLNETLKPIADQSKAA
jgi:recombination protein RecT